MKNVVIGSLVVLLLITSFLAYVFLFSHDDEYVYTMENIQSRFSSKNLVEVIGKAPEPYKELIPITIAGIEQGDGSVLTYENERPNRTLFKAIPGHLTILHPFASKNGRIVYAVVKEKNEILSQPKNSN